MDDFIYDDGSMVPFTKYTYVLHYSRGHFKMKLSKMQYIRCIYIVHCASIIIPNPEGFLSTHRNCYYCFPTPSSIPVLPILILPTPWMRCGVIYVVVGKSLKRGQFLGFYAKIVIFRVFFQSLQKELRENSFKIRWFQRLK